MRHDGLMCLCEHHHGTPSKLTPLFLKEQMLSLAEFVMTKRKKKKKVQLTGKSEQTGHWPLIQSSSYTEWYSSLDTDWWILEMALNQEDRMKKTIQLSFSKDL